MADGVLLLPGTGHKVVHVLMTHKTSCSREFIVDDDAL